MKLKKGIAIAFIFVLLSMTLFISYSKELKNLPTTVLYFLTSNFQPERKQTLQIDFIDLYISKLTKTTNHFKKKEKKESVSVVDKIVYNTLEPIVYIYNTHTNEEYSYKKNDIYNIVPTVKTASYILEEELKKLGISSIVEPENTTNIINDKKMSYSESYTISKKLLQNKQKEYKSLTYFIDVHRDSVKREITTTTINGVTYARVMFLLGLENPNYPENKKVLTVLNDYLNKNYKGLSRGIYEKQGKGVNGVYNQDISSNVLVIEVGGVDNTIEEVNNSLKIIANCLFNYINDSKTTKKE